MALLRLSGQARFSISLTPAEINKDEYTTLRILIENADNVQDLTPPNLKDFIVLSGPNPESGMRTVNGTNVMNYVAVTFLLKPKRSGDFILNAAVARISGKLYKSNALKFFVKNSLSGRLTTISPIKLMSGYGQVTKGITLLIRQGKICN